MLKIETSKSGTVDIEGALTVHNLSELHEALSRVLSELPLDKKTTVSLAGVDKIDTAGAQTLLAFKRTRQAGLISFAAFEEIARQLHGTGLDSGLFS